MSLPLELGYWVGPYGVQIPVYILSVPAADEVNSLTLVGNRVVKSNIVTSNVGCDRAQYIAKYAEERDGAVWFKDLD